MIGSTQGRFQLQHGKPVAPKPAARPGRSAQAAAPPASAAADTGAATNRTGEHRVVSGLKSATNASVSHSATAAPQATYSLGRARPARAESQNAPPGAAEFALREALGRQTTEEGQAPEEVREAPAEDRVPEKDLVEHHREAAVAKLEDLDSQARTEASQAGAVAPLFEFQVGPDARAYRVDFRAPPEPAQHDGAQDHGDKSEARPTAEAS